MEGQATKLTRTSSSLLRSPTLRSIQSLSAVGEDGGNSHGHDHDETKIHTPIPPACPSYPSFTSPVLLAILSLLFLILFFHLREDLPVLGNLSLFAAVVSAASVAARRSWLLKLRAGRGLPKGGSSVQWFIGDNEYRVLKKEKKENGQGNADDGIVMEGVEFFGDGDYYEGEFHKGRCNGSGVYNYIGSGRYEGDWVDGKYDGFGIESWARGSRYRGQYRQGLRHGLGVYRFYTGDSYAGQWFNGQSHGVGVQTCSDGSCYVGEFKCGVKHGLGYYHFRNGDRYSGEYFGDKIHGFGVYAFANGHCYEGSWHEGRKQGFGSYTFRNGEMRSGEWDSGVLKRPLPQWHDAVQKAVQGARKATEKAIRLNRVDEQVNKAVSAANRAATAARVAAIKAVQNRMDGKFFDTHV